MKFVLELASRSADEPNVNQKHKRLIEGLTLIGKPWGIEIGDYPIPPFGQGITSIFRLNKLLGNGIKGDVMYSYRRKLCPEDDDRIYLDFDPKKINYETFYKNIFPKYIAIFKPYQGSIFNQEIIHYDYGHREEYDLVTFFRFNPIFFIDEKYCREKLGLSTKDLKRKVAGVVESAELFENGILVIADSKLVNVEESNELNLRLKNSIAGNK